MYYIYKFNFYHINSWIYFDYVTPTSLEPILCYPNWILVFYTFLIKFDIWFEETIFWFKLNKAYKMCLHFARNYLVVSDFRNVYRVDMFLFSRRTNSANLLLKLKFIYQQMLYWPKKIRRHKNKFFNMTVNNWYSYIRICFIFMDF